MRHLGNLAGVLLVLGACAPERADVPAVTTTDSSGVTISEIHPDSIRSVPIHTVIDTLVVIGGSSFADAVTFGSITDVARTEEGIVALDWQAGEAQVFSLDGALLEVMGRPGEGPGEFTSPLFVDVYRRDSLFVGEIGRFHVFYEGELARTTGLRPVIPNAVTVGTTSEGRIVFRSARNDSDSTDIVAYDPDGSEGEPVITLFRADRQLFEQDDQRFAVRQLFGREARFAASRTGDGFLYTQGGHFEVREFDWQGRLRRVVRSPIEPEEVSASDASAMRERWIQSEPPGNQAAARRLYSELAARPYKPIVERLFSGADGHIWLLPADWQEPGESDEARPKMVEWIRLGQHGQPLARVVLPETFQLHFARGDTIIGVFMDELDIQSIRAWRVGAQSN